MEGSVSVKGRWLGVRFQSPAPTATMPLFEGELWLEMVMRVTGLGFRRGAYMMIIQSRM